MVDERVGKFGRERILAVLAGETVNQPARGEIWPLPGGGTAESTIAAAKELEADFCFFDHFPGSTTRAHTMGLAAGAVINGPWQRWMIAVGWENAMLSVARGADSVQQGLESAAEIAGRELSAWAATGVDIVLLADDIAYAGGPYMSPQQIDRYLIPIYKELRSQAVKIGLAIGFHTDGCVDLVLPVLRKVDFCFYSLEPEGTDPLTAWNLLGSSVPLLSGLPAAWLMPGGFLPTREGRLLREWLEAGPLVLSSACGLYHGEAKKSLQVIYQWMDDEKNFGSSK